MGDPPPPPRSPPLTCGQHSELVTAEVEIPQRLQLPHAGRQCPQLVTADILGVDTDEWVNEAR